MPHSATLDVTSFATNLVVDVLAAPDPSSLTLAGLGIALLFLSFRISSRFSRELTTTGSVSRGLPVQSGGTCFSAFRADGAPLAALA
jgi:hypothetical protein